MLRAAFMDSVGDPGERRFIVTIMSDVEPASLTVTGADVEGMADVDIVACGSQIISPTDTYLAFEDGLFKVRT